MKKKNGNKLIISILSILLLCGFIYFFVAIPNGFFGQVVVSILILLITILDFVVLIVIIAKYNKLVKYKNKVEESLALIDIHLKLRFDLIPNLVGTVKGYMEHEKETLKEITKLRNLAAESPDEKEKLEYANQLVPKMKHIFAVAENYPDLKADSVFRNLMTELVLIEDKLVASRRFYDSNVNEYNTLIGIWPSNLVAKMYGFGKCELFKIDSGENIAMKISLE